MAFCIDASALIPWLIPLPASAQVNPFWIQTIREQNPLVAPPLLFAEVTSVLRRHVHLGIVLPQEAILALQELFGIPISVVQSPDVYLRALEFASRLGQARAYDAQYLAVAEIHGCTIVTMDRGLYQSARTLGLEARLLP